MYLKAVELQGFKSFPDKTRLSFENNITAIVGPNGSGKSNISDAIRWVMGEQRTKQLRGEKMEDVIFGGTEKRGKLGYAKVSLIFDNSTHFFPLDAGEVVLSRAYYRTGESEYSINREVVRLKDVNELLMDTGLGRDGYSNIGQGRIAEIVSGSGQERRNVLEEASGISRYRYRKEEAERKLDRTQENLVRINDRIAELELQVAPLKKQAEVARKCLEYQGELKTLEVSVWMEQLDTLQSRAEAVRNDYAAAKQNLDATHEELRQMYAAGEELNRQMQEKTVETERLRAELSLREARGAELESAAAVQRTNFQNVQNQLVRMQLEMEEQEKRADSLAEQIGAHDCRLQTIGEELKAVQAQGLAVLQQVAENTKVTGDARQKYGELAARENSESADYTGCRTQINLLTEQMQVSRERETAAESTGEQSREQLAELRQQWETGKQAAKDAEERTAGLRKQLDEKQNAIGRAEQRLQQLQESYNGRMGDWKAADSRITLLEDMEREHEGFNRAVRFVLKEKERGSLRGIRGAVGELIHTEDAYAIAIETALGAAAQNVVVETQEDGAEAIRLLKRRDMGRCTFLPMNVIRGTDAGTVPRRDTGFVEVADRLVTCDPEYREIVSNLLGRTVVVRTMEDAIRISRGPGGSKIRMVTLDGQMIHAGGSMTGGSLAKNTGILSRANELKRLQQRREELRNDLERLKQDGMAARQAVEDAKLAAETARGQLDAGEETLQQRRLEADRLELQVKTGEESLTRQDRERESFRQQTEEYQNRLQTLQQQAEQLRQQLEQTRSELREMSAGQTENERVRQELSEQLSELKAKEASLRTEQITVEQARQQVIDLQATMDSDRADRQEETEKLRRELETLEEQIKAGDAAVEENTRQTCQLRETAEERNRQRLELEGMRNKTDKQAQECNRQLLEMERLCAKFEQKKLASEMEEKQIIDRLWDNYGLSHSDAVKLRTPVEKPGAANRRISELHQAIARLGTPNFGAIEEYARVSERYEFLTAQRDDVEQAKKEIQQIIREVTTQMKDVFETQFALINESFRETFRELFGGGKASLVLQDETDVLGCGIDIQVQPPGKAVSSINLLSGGEMAFVAIALYFAIMKVRPTPFCVMDEIEAALDEANVIRFAEYLRTMCTATQFIVITHRRGTMEEANRLYGVTMQEKGVSQVIELDIAEAERQIAAQEG